MVENQTRDVIHLGGPTPTRPVTSAKKGWVETDPGESPLLYKQMERERERNKALSQFLSEHPEAKVTQRFEFHGPNRTIEEHQFDQFPQAPRTAFYSAAQLSDGSWFVACNSGGAVEPVPYTKVQDLIESATSILNQKKSSQ